jgi:phosphohistidine phosphatase
MSQPPAHPLRTLILLRHAKSAWPQGTADAQRPLAARGRRDAPAAGRWLRKHVPAIDLVVCSPARRARQTGELVAAELDTAPALRCEDRLYAASAQVVAETVRELPEEVSTVLLVGHNPTMEHVLTLLTGTAEIFKTSTIAVLRTPVGWAATACGSWTLEALATPRGS